MEWIKYHEAEKVFDLRTEHSTYQMQVREYDTLVHLYYGSPVGDALITDRIVCVDRGFSGNPYEAEKDKTFSLDTLPQEYTAYGNGDYRINGLETEQADGSDTANLKFESYEITKGKYSLKGLPAMFAKEDETETEDETEKGAGTESGVKAPEYDEHVWTSPLNAVKIVEQIKEELCEIDSENASDYEENAEAYVAQLKELDQEFQDVVDHSKRKLMIFGDRFPFRYFAEAYGLDYYAAFSGCASDTEPSAATMAFLINKVQDENIKTVLKMELSNENIAKAIAEATNADVKEFYSCHNLTAEQFADGETYLSLMEKNVETLREVLN